MPLRFACQAKLQRQCRLVGLIPSKERRSRTPALRMAGNPAGAVLAIEFVERSVAARFARSAHCFGTGCGTAIAKPQLVVGRPIVRRRRTGAQDQRHDHRVSPLHRLLSSTWRPADPETDRIAASHACVFMMNDAVGKKSPRTRESRRGRRRDSSAVRGPSAAIALASLGHATPS